MKTPNHKPLIDEFAQRSEDYRRAVADAVSYELAYREAPGYSVARNACLDARARRSKAQQRMVAQANLISHEINGEVAALILDNAHRNASLAESIETDRVRLVRSRRPRLGVA